MPGRTRPAIAVRRPAQDDEQALRRLLAQLGYDVALEQLRTHLRELSESPSDAVLVATSDNAVVGTIALHWSIVLQHRAPIGRIMTLVVDDGARGQGVGRVLVDAGAELARQAGCGALELTTALHRAGAHAFYRALGFTNSSLKFARAIDA